MCARRLEADVAEHLELAPHHGPHDLPAELPQVSSTSASSTASAAVYRRASGLARPSVLDAPRPRMPPQRRVS